MAGVIREWLQSGQFIPIEDIDLLPLATDERLGPVALKGKRAEVFFMRSSGDQLWVIKKFISNDPAQIEFRDSVKALIPHRPGFEAGYLRKVLSLESISNPDFREPHLSEWIDNAVLMPAVAGVNWSVISHDVRDGRQYLPKKNRISLVRSLCEKVRWLEGQDLSHRDLSAPNVLVDLKEADVHLVDWDSIFHPSLTMPEDLTRGTRGYIAPFLNVRGVADGRHTWKEHADRFHLALLNAEILSITESFPTTGESGMCDQDELYNRSGPCLDAILTSLKSDYARAATLLEQALGASSFDECPEPSHWIESVGAMSAVPTKPIPIRDRPAFAQLNQKGFTRLNESVFAKLNRYGFAQQPYRMKTS